MSDIFISYKREEQNVAKKLADALERHGWSIWWDPQLRAGEYFDDVIEEALINSKCLVVLWSQRSVKSRFVKDEATYALEQGTLVPAQIEDVRLPFRFANIHTIQMFGWDGSEDDPAYQRLTKAISKILDTARSAEGNNQTPRLKDSEAKYRDGGSRTRLAIDSTMPDALESKAEIRDVLGDGSQGPLMVIISEGTFQMGDSNYRDEIPVHEVTIAKKFAIGKYPVTFQEYDHFASITNRQLPEDKGWGRHQRPVINVSWHDAVAYVAWLSEQTGAHYRLPSESEWEYAARAGTDTPFWWGNDVSKYGESRKGGKLITFPRLFNKQTTDVGNFPANSFGIHDSSGNVFEWVSDCWHDQYRGAPADGSAWLEADGGDCGQRVMRGGAWDADSNFMRSAARHKYHPGLRYAHVGFRVARDLS